MNDKKFKVGDKVRVIRRSMCNEVHWAPPMNRTIGKIYIVLEIARNGNLLLNTELNVPEYDQRNFWFPPKGVQKLSLKNQQLMFEFMMD